MRTFWVYILGSRSGTLYVGVTNDLERRLAEHRSGLEKGFTARYAVHRLLYFEQTTGVISALEREKQLKRWSRRKKVELIESGNPGWRDLSAGW
jgi:putative endonuclease